MQNFGEVTPEFTYMSTQAFTPTSVLSDASYADQNSAKNSIDYDRAGI